MALVQYPKLANSNLLKLIKSNSRFSFILDVKDIYILYPDSPASLILEKIENEKIRNIFGEALVSEIKLSLEDAESMIDDCLKLILQLDSQREQFLIEKFNMKELSSAEKRELQQIILKKDKMSPDDEALIKNLSSN